MNAGMFGLPSGSAVGGRIVRRNTPSNYSLISNISNAVLCSGIANPIAYTPVAGARTRVLSLSGKGYLKFVAVTDGGASANTSITSELYIDGVMICSATLASTSGTSGNGHILVGGVGGAAAPYPYVVMLEQVPFQLSAELYVTRSTTASTAYTVAYDIYE